MARKAFLLCMALCVIALLSLAVVAFAQPAAPLTPKEELGKSIFFDENLSINRNQSCATCHAPVAGWTGADSAINAGGAVYEGSIPGAFGDRKPPSAAYATQSPIFTWTARGCSWAATSGMAGPPARSWAAPRPNRPGPLPEPEGAGASQPGRSGLKVCAAAYGDLFRQVWGADACANVAMAYDNIGYSVAAYEASPEVNAFSSKFDLTKSGKVKLSKEERRGYALFRGKGKCSACHVANGQRPLFTDYTFDNLGLPKNPENPVYQGNPGFVDPGLGGFLATRSDYAVYADANMGKHKVPTLRNVALRRRA